MSTPNKNYGNLIWTNHAVSRLNQRGFSQEMAWKAFVSPDSTEKEKEGSIKFSKKFDKSTVTVIAKQNEKREWIIISCWIYPPLEGTHDYIKKQEFEKYKNSSGFRKILAAFIRQISF